MAKENETVADIIAEMRGDGHTGPADALEWVRIKLEHYANRLDAAAKRLEWTHKKELETRDAVIQTEAAGREAEREAHKRERGNCAKLREAAEFLYRIVHCAMVAGVFNRDDANKAMDDYHAARAATEKEGGAK